jgi:hypothetical protein
LEVLDHPFTGEEFGHFVASVLDQMQPWPMSKSVLVMDNASIHKVAGIRDMVEEWYVSFYFVLINTDMFVVACGSCTCHHIHLI